VCGLVAARAECGIAVGFVRVCERTEFEWSTRAVSTDQSDWDLLSI
jgi:hypothetical protein